MKRNKILSFNTFDFFLLVLESEEIYEWYSTSVITKQDVS